MKAGNKIIIAHRGESHDAPENTLASVNLAWNRGADAVEIDIHLSADGKIFVIHDENTRRTCGLDKEVKDQTAGELKQLDAGSFKSDQYAGEKIPLLEEILSTVPPGKKIIVEIKCGLEVIPELKRVTENSGLKAEQIDFISFDLDVIKTIKREIPDCRSLLLDELDYGPVRKIFKPSLVKLIETAELNKLDGLDLWAGKILDRDAVETIKNSGLLLYVWTVDDPDHAAGLFSWGADGVTTNRAAWLKNEIIRKNKFL